MTANDRVDAEVAAMSITEVLLVVGLSDNVDAIKEGPASPRHSPGQVEVANELRIADLAIVIDDGVFEQADLVLELPGHVGEEGEIAPTAQTVLDEAGNVDPLITLTCDVDVFVVDRRDGCRIGSAGPGTRE